MEQKIDAIQVINYYKEKLADLEYQLALMTVAATNAQKEIDTLKEKLFENLPEPKE